MRPVLYTAAVLGACAVASVFRPAHSQPPERLPDLAAADAPANPHARPYGVGKAPFDQRPATSCSASSCHGGGAIGKVGSEHTTWAPEAFPRPKDDPNAGSDPHTKAYRVLFNSVSVGMAAKLDLEDAKGNRKVAAHQATLCLKCHAVDGVKDEATRDQILSEGVGCGACHGPADKWVGIHYTSEWKALTNREKWDKYGFVPAGNLVARTLNCAGCHSGDADRDVNHDLYAAGHPRLAFEAAALRSATALLRARAEKPDGVWPEFASYSCYACHQRVGEGAVRGDLSDAVRADGGTRRLGVPGWEIWSNTALGIAAEYCREAYPGLSSPDLTAVTALRKLMGSSRAPARTEVVAAATKALAELDGWLAAMQAADDNRAALKPVPKGTAERLAHALAKNAIADKKPNDAKADSRLKDHDWDALAANYLGCAAMYHATGGAAGNKWGGELDAVRQGLRFRPRAGEGGRPDSPTDFDANKLKRLLTNFGSLRDAATLTGGK